MSLVLLFYLFCFMFCQFEDGWLFHLNNYLSIINSYLSIIIIKMQKYQEDDDNIEFNDIDIVQYQDKRIEIQMIAEDGHSIDL